MAEIITNVSEGTIELPQVSAPGNTANKLYNVGGVLTFGGSSGGGDVTKVGTPANNQIGIWTGDGTIEGVAALTWDGTELLTTGDFHVSSINPQVRFTETDAGTNVKNWKWQVQGQTLAMQLWNDAWSSGSNTFSFVRTLNNLDTVNSAADETFLSKTGGTLTFQDGATASKTGTSPGKAKLWVRNDTPDNLIFVDDAGTEFVIGGNLAATGIVTEDVLRNIVGGTDAGAALDGAFGADCTIIGYNAGKTMTAPSGNTAYGAQAAELTTGSSNVAIGFRALQNQTTGANNIGIGVNAFRGQISSKLTGSWNIGIGSAVGINAQTAFRNVVIGYSATNLTSGDDNVIIGHNGAALMSQGTDNVIIGSEGGANINTGVGNVILGKNAGPTSEQSNRLYLHNAESNTPTIGANFATGAVELSGTIRFTERADHIGTPAATFGELWVKTATPNELYFTDDAGTDWLLNQAGAGDVSKVGTPVNNQVGIWTGDGTIEGDAALTYHSTTGLVIGDFGQLTVNGGGTGAGTFKLGFDGSNVMTMSMASGGTCSLSVTGTSSTFLFGDTIQTTASVSGKAGFKIPEGVAPSSPADGDVWVTAAGAFNARLNGVTVDLAAGGGGDVSKVGTPVNNQIGIWTGNGTIEGVAALTYDGTELSTSGILAVNAADPRIRISESDASANNKNYQLRAFGNTLALGLYNDAWSLGTNALVFTRALNVLTEVTVNGNSLSLATPGGTLVMQEAAAPAVINAAGKGRLWVKNTVPNTLIFTDDTSVEHDLTAAGGVFTETGTNNLYTDAYTGSGDHNFLALDGAGDSLTTGTDNIAIGENAGTALANGGNNVIFGRDALSRAVSSGNTVAIGVNAGAGLTTGQTNIAIGGSSLGTAAASVVGDDNIAIGFGALGSATMGNANDNVGIGSAAMFTITVGDDNTAVGYASLSQVTTGGQNSSFGKNSGFAITTGTFNTAIGYGAVSGAQVMTGSNNIALGANAFADNPATVSGSDNIGIGEFACRAITSASDSIAIGREALGHTTPSSTGSDNIAIGRLSMASAAITTANQNIAIGLSALDAVTTGDSNVIIGNTAGLKIVGGDNNVAIGKSAGPTTNTSDRLYINNAESDAPMIGGNFATGAVELSGTIRFTERADHIGTPTATFGELWVKTATPNELYFTDDAGTDWLLNSAGAGGDVTKVGTPVNNQVGVWTGDGTIEGDTDLTFDGTVLTTAELVTTAAVTMPLISTAAASLTLDATHYTVAATLAGTQTITLPTAVGITGRLYNIKKTGASGTTTVATTSSQTIDGITTFVTTTQYQSITVQSDGANWLII